MKTLPTLFSASIWLLGLSQASAALNINYDFTSMDYQSSDFTLQGDSYWIDNTGNTQIQNSGRSSERLRVTNNQGEQNGAAWLNTSTIDATQDWNFSFEFQVTEETNGSQGAEGIAFSIQKHGTGYLPTFPDFSGNDPNMGLVINLDLYQNDGDPVSDELEVWYNGTVISNADNWNLGAHFPTDYVFTITASYDSNSNELAVTAQTVNGGTTYNYSQTMSIVLSDLTDATVGFSAATGGIFNGNQWYGENHDVLNFSGTAVPEPRAFAAIAGLLAFALVARRRGKV